MRSVHRVLLAALLATSPFLAHAEAGGLRLKEHSKGITLNAVENGLKLQFVPAPAQVPSAEQSGLSLGERAGRSTLRAEMASFAPGLHTTFGLDWTSITGRTDPSLNTLEATPFLGLGWQSGARESSRWHLSAEVGTAFSAGQPCNPLVGCSATQPRTGLNPYASGSGLRLNPYVNFGATYTFGQ